MLLDLVDEPHAGIRAHVHGGQDRYDDKEPGGRAGRVHSFDHPVLLPREEKGGKRLFFTGTTEVE